MRKFRVLELSLLLCLFTTLAQIEKSEIDWLTNTIHSIGDTTMVYVFVTNLPYSQIHPPPPSTNTSANSSHKRVAEEIQGIPSPNPIPNPSLNPQPLYPPISLPNNLWMKSIFLPKVDQLAILRISTLSYSNSSFAYLAWMAKYPNLYVYLQVGNGTSAIQSSPKRYWATDSVIGSYSAVIRLQNGQVTDIEWDDGCQECNADRCLDNVCSLELSSCVTTNAMCDMKFYLAWIGTDANGINCNSAGNLPSNLMTFSYGPVYPQAAMAAPNNALTIIGQNG